MYRAMCFKMGVLHRCACAKQSTKGGYRTNLPEKVSRDTGYRSDRIAQYGAIKLILSGSHNLGAVPLYGMRMLFPARIGADFLAGDAIKHSSVKQKKGFSVKRGDAFSERRAR